MSFIRPATFEMARMMRDLTRTRSDTDPNGPLQELGDACFRIDPHSQGEFASQNANRVEHLGVEGLASEEHLDTILAAYATAAVPRAFFYLSPCPQAADVKQWLLARGLTREKVGLSVLWRDCSDAEGVETDLAIDCATLDDARDLERAAHAEWANAEAWSVAALDVARRALTQPNAHAFVARDGSELAAVATLLLHDELGYLCHAATLDRFRGRHAQRALIGARIAHAYELGCRWVAAESYFFLHPSYDNLVKAGFDDAYQRSIWLWRQAPPREQL
jgi:hypothetical protein